MDLNGSKPLMKVLGGHTADRPPFWFMRQAGRYLPEYREIRSRHPGFIEFCFSPEDAAEVTLQPLRRYDMDAAILFADILLIPGALGQNVRFVKGEGPLLEPSLSPTLVSRLSAEGAADRLSPIYETVARVRRELGDNKTLIGFAGSPWTVATYMINGRGTKDPSAARVFAYREPQAMADLMEMLVSSTAEYLIRQAEAGADVLKLFDSWAAGLPEPLFDLLCLRPNVEIARRVKAKVDVPIIYFPKGSGPLYLKVAQSGAFDGLALDTHMPMDWAKRELGPKAVLQGGMDPLLVVEGGKAMRDEAERLIATFEGTPYIFNLGHGFVPETPPEHVAELSRIIKGI
ncbi:uroporphyrinogen decarboxylase [Parvularcula mediterranea]|nr:uroporphyrinogen decarboxylase [Parvularcula mediterranea]